MTLNSQTKKNTTGEIAATLAVSLFAVCLFSFEKGYIVGTIALMLCSLVAAYHKQLAWHSGLTLLGVAFILVLTPHIINLIQGTSDLDDIKKAARGIPLLLVAAFLAYNKPKQSIVYLALTSALIICFVFMLRMNLEGYPRRYLDGFNINPLMMSVTAVLAFILPKTNSQNKYLRLVVYSVFTLTVSSVVMSQSKGPFLALLSVLTVFSCCALLRHNKVFTTTKLNVVVLWLLLIASAVVTSSQINDGLISRISLASKEIAAEVAEANSSKQPTIRLELEDSSEGVRIELWRGASILASEKPLFGYGKKMANQRMAELVNEGKLAPYMAKHSGLHFHSIYFNALGYNGVFGLITILLLLIIPAYILVKNRMNNPLVAFSGILVIINYAVVGAADVALTSTLPYITYIFLMTICVSLVLTKKEA